MPGTEEFLIGTEATCTDGVCGELRQVVINPVARTITHIVIEPKHREGLGRLVPLEIVDASPAEIRLACTMAEFNKLPHAEDIHFLPGSEALNEYPPGQALIWPYFGLSVGNVSPPVTTDTLPAGEVAIHRDEHVHATDGDIGQVQGLVVDPRNHHATHVLLQEGHLWGRKQVAIPISAVASVQDGILLNIDKQAVQDLPPVDLDAGPGADAGRRGAGST
jgi:sporulation protein YlmC with PRC-barrel domain